MPTPDFNDEFIPIPPGTTINPCINPDRPAAIIFVLDNVDLVNRNFGKVDPIRKCFVFVFKPLSLNQSY